MKLSEHQKQTTKRLTGHDRDEYLSYLTQGIGMPEFTVEQAALNDTQLGIVLQQLEKHRCSHPESKRWIPPHLKEWREDVEKLRAELI